MPEYLSCIYCGRTKPVNTLRSDLNRFDNFDIAWKILQIRTQAAGPGRGHTRAKLNAKGQEHGGFKLVQGEGLSIEELVEDPTYADLVDGIKRRIIKITKAYIEAGIIKREELI